MDYFLKEEQECSLKNAGPKANLDIERALGEEGIMVRKDCIIPNFHGNQWVYHWRKFMLMLKLLWISFREKNQRFILLYPSQLSGRAKKFSFVFDRLRKSNEIYAFCTDIDALRSDIRPIQLDIEELNKFDGIVIYNKKIRDYLTKHGLLCHKVVELGLLDYYTSLERIPKRKLNDVVVYAGNLEISSFLIPLSKAQLGFQLNLYGNGFKASNSNENIFYKGTFNPEELVTKMEGAFGLVWGGNSIDSLDGYSGTYLQYSLPHKLSLYMVAGMPVIVPADAAVAELVRREGLGLIIHDLREIPNAIAALSSEGYGIYCKNCYRFAQKLSVGYYTKKALKQLLV